MLEPRIAVLGAGANGAGIGADLVRAGLDVTFIDQWPANVEAMRRTGITVVMPDETVVTEVRALHLCEIATLRSPFDLVFVLVKAYDTRWACELIAPLLGPESLVIGLQNGMSIDDMALAVGRHRTIGAVIEVSANMFQPGVSNRQSPPSRSWFAVGAIERAHADRELEVVSVLQHAGTVERSTDIRSSKWMKLVANAAELLPPALLGLPLADAVDVPGMRELMLEAGREALRAALGDGNRMVPIFGRTEADVPDSDRYVEDLLDAVLTEYTLADTRTTILQDWMKDRRSEVDQINGLVVDLERRRGADAPVNAKAVDLAHLIESGALRPGLNNLELLTADPDRVQSG